jgi:hypothetical protein
MERLITSDRHQFCHRTGPSIINNTASKQNNKTYPQSINQPTTD